MTQSPRRRKWWPWLIGAIVVTILLLLRFGDQFLPRKWWPPHDRSGHGFYSVRSAAELAEVPWYENTVWVSDAELTDKQLSDFLQNNSIGELRLIRTPKITSKGLEGLEHSRDLRALDVAQLNVDDSIAETLSKLDSIERLNLSYTKIHELSDDVFENNPDLWMLDVGGCEINRNFLIRCAAHRNLRNLDLSRCTGVSAEDLAGLAQSTSLELVEMKSVHLSAATLEQLCSIPTLKQLWIHWARGVTPEQVNSLRASFPNIEISYSEP